MPKHDVSHLCERIRSVHPSSLGPGGRAHGSSCNTGAGAAKSILICCRGLVPKYAVQRRREGAAADGDVGRLAGLDYWVCADDCHACKAGLLDQGCDCLGRIEQSYHIQKELPMYPLFYKLNSPYLPFLCINFPTLPVLALSRFPIGRSLLARQPSLSLSLFQLPLPFGSGLLRPVLPRQLVYVISFAGRSLLHMPNNDHLPGFCLFAFFPPLSYSGMLDLWCIC
jgi:hypothetical protein